MSVLPKSLPEPSARAVAELPSWQAAVRDAVRDPVELAELLELPRTTFELADAQSFPLLVPRSFVARMRKRDRLDPLLLQVLPQPAEHYAQPTFSDDPLRERDIAARGVLRKYARRALLIASGACPVHCRYCFRRAFPYQAQLAARGDWAAALDELAKFDDVREVILSGGDPLSLSNRRLARLLGRLEVAGVETLRIHTRFPIVVPERVDPGLITLLERTALDTVVVVHCNHANELDAAVATALGALRATVGFVLNQSVLLRGVNDDDEVLASLSERLFACGVLPYYLHLLDPVAGAAHFDVSEDRGRTLIGLLRARLPGYLVPRLVRETPGDLSKTVLA
jgi:EF-P beta-lysylation protein EpmB